MTQLEMGLKVCSRCMTELPVWEFHNSITGTQRVFAYCKPCHRDYIRERYHSDPEWRAKVLARARRSGKTYRAGLRTAALAAYGGMCACCGEATVEFLSIDHINGGGAKQRRETGLRGQSFYRWLRENNWPGDFRVLCHNCNQARGAYGYCPHEREREQTA